ncbi:hypothetical protein ACHAW5_005314 [Stephanodiscus triporus]|uniref:Uncharacterized protein n=1 Tax=Stephanodiscus triporus TaxID=2934178 RepID=A0ABD3NC39_9STRA
MSIVMSSTNTDVSRIPQIISCNEFSLDISLDNLQLAIDATDVEKSNESTSIMKDESTANESVSSGYDGDGADISSDDDTSSSQSYHTNDSARRLLRQARKRLQHQSILEENKILKAEVSQYKNSVDSALRQKLDLKIKCDTLESQLAQAMETIQHHKVQELRWSDERAQRERDFMNQLNDLCSEMKGNEEVMMGEIIERDQMIREMQIRLNAAEGRRSKGVMNDMENRDVVAHVEFDMDDESWNDDSSSCEFI